MIEYHPDNKNKLVFYLYDQPGGTLCATCNITDNATLDMTGQTLYKAKTVTLEEVAEKIDAWFFSSIRKDSGVYVITHKLVEPFHIRVLIENFTGNTNPTIDVLRV